LHANEAYNVTKTHFTSNTIFYFTTLLNQQTKRIAKPKPTVYQKIKPLQPALSLHAPNPAQIAQILPISQKA
jgi:hypothetical protein